MDEAGKSTSVKLPPISHRIRLIWRLLVKLRYQSSCLPSAKVRIIWKCPVSLLLCSLVFLWPRFLVFSITFRFWSWTCPPSHSRSSCFLFKETLHRRYRVKKAAAKKCLLLHFQPMTHNPIMPRNIHGSHSIHSCWAICFTILTLHNKVTLRVSLLTVKLCLPSTLPRHTVEDG